MLERLTAAAECPLDKLLIVLSEGVYYDPVARSTIRTLENYYDVVFNEAEKLIPLLPEAVKRVVTDNKLFSTAVVGGHVALLFDNEPERIRRIVTDTDLIQLSEVTGYKYLDVSPEGAPFVRCVTKRGGGRAFSMGNDSCLIRAFKPARPR